MSAVILSFPSKPRAISERRRAVKEAVDSRAKATQASLEDRRAAIGAAFDSLDRGDAAGEAIRCGWAKLPSVRRQAYRVPSNPDAA